MSICDGPAMIPRSGTAWCLFAEGVSERTSVELGSGSHNCVAESITETGISAAWHFVINSVS